MRAGIWPWPCNILHVQLLVLSHFPRQLGQSGAACFPGGYCQRGGMAVTPCGPAMQQQMDPQHHGRGNICVDVCWGVGDGSWVRAMALLRAWASLQLKKGRIKSLWSCLGAWHWNQCPAHRPSSPAVLCPWVSPSPCTTPFPDLKELGGLPCSPLCETGLPGRVASGKFVLYF